MAQAVWAERSGDAAQQAVAAAEVDRLERLVGDWLEGTREPVQRARWRLPNPSTRRRSRYRD